MIRVNSKVQLAHQGSARFHIPQRYAGRTGRVAKVTKAGSTKVYQIDLGSRRKEFLPVTAGLLTVL